MKYSKRTLEGMSNEESESLFIELSTLYIPDDVWTVISWLDQKGYQDVWSMHDLVDHIKKDKSKTAEDVERVYHVLGFLQYMGLKDD